MANGQLRTAIQELRRLVGPSSESVLSDGQLLENFLSRRDQASFEVLVWRHGTMVLGLCQRILNDSHEAEDAFQATFLVFARKAGSIGKRQAVGSWLYKVAYRVALRLKAKAGKTRPCRQADARLLDELPGPETAVDLVWRDLRPVLDEEIGRLPEKYRAPFVLCYLEGQSNKDAAEQLGCPEGTILSRLARGRERLRSRLTRRGLALAGVTVAAALSQSASASAPAPLVALTVNAAIPFAAGKGLASLVSAPVALLTEGVLRTMLLTKLKLAAAALVAIAVLTTGTGALIHRTLAKTPALSATSEAAPAADIGAPYVEEYGERGGREGRRAPELQGRISAVADDGKTLTIESGGRGEEPKKTVVKLTDKTDVEFAGVLKDVFKKIKVGDGAAVWFQEGSKDTAATVQVHRGPDISSKIVAVAADGKSLTVVVPGRERGEEPTKIDIKLSDKTKIQMGRGEAAKLSAGNMAAVWLVEGSKDTAAALVVSQPRADVAGAISAMGADGKEFTVESKGRSGEPVKTGVKLSNQTKIEFIGGETKDNRLKVGHAVAVWLQENSKDTARLVQVNLQRRSPDLVGTITAVSQDNKTVSLEIRRRDADSTKIDIKLTDKTEVEFAGTDKAEERKLLVGYTGAVWLQEGSKDTAAVFRAIKPAERSR